MSKQITTIKIEKETKLRLDKLKEHNRESYNEIIKKILHILNVFRKSPESANKLLRYIDLSISRNQDYIHKNKPISNKKPKLSSIPQSNPQQNKDSH